MTWHGFKSCHGQCRQWGGFEDITLDLIRDLVQSSFRPMSWSNYEHTL